MASKHIGADEPSICQKVTSNTHTQLETIEEMQLVSDHDAQLKTECENGKCGHPRAKRWIAYDQCNNWFHCMCVNVPYKKALKDFNFKCSVCSV